MKELETTELRDLAVVVKHKAHNASDCLSDVSSNMYNFTGYNSQLDRISTSTRGLATC